MKSFLICGFLITSLASCSSKVVQKRQDNEELLRLSGEYLVGGNRGYPMGFNGNNQVQTNFIDTGFGQQSFALPGNTYTAGGDFSFSGGPVFHHPVNQGHDNFNNHGYFPSGIKIHDARNLYPHQSHSQPVYHGFQHQGWLPNFPVPHGMFPQWGHHYGQPNVPFYNQQHPVPAPSYIQKHPAPEQSFEPPLNQQHHVPIQTTLPPYSQQHPAPEQSFVPPPNQQHRVPIQTTLPPYSQQNPVPGQSTAPPYIQQSSIPTQSTISPISQNSVPTHQHNIGAQTESLNYESDETTVDP